MKLRHALLCLFVVGVQTLYTASALCLEPQRTFIGPDHPHVVSMGRFTDDYRFGWTATGVQMQFDGTAASILLELSRGQGAAMQVVIDGEPTRVLLVSPEKIIYTLAENLPAGPHHVEVWKQSEGALGELKFGGFQLSTGAKTLPLNLPLRNMLVIGDSISCGYGNEAKSIPEGNSVSNENGYLAYGPITARNLSANIMMVCWSGRGLYRNRSLMDDKSGILPDLFEQTLPLESSPKWDHGKFTPQVVVINLGTNDLFRGPEATKPSLGKEQFLAAYRTFIKTLKEYYPEVEIITSIGPLGTEPISSWLSELAAGDNKVHALVFENLGDSKYLGGHYHPSVAMNLVMARTLTTMVSKTLDWNTKAETSTIQQP